jgi:predicted nucleotidyltransferase
LYSIRGLILLSYALPDTDAIWALNIVGVAASAMEIKELIKEKREQILEAAEKRGVCNVRVFGSVARGDSQESNDLDLLVDLEPGRTLFDLGGLLMDLQELLGCKVDILTEPALHWYIRDRVLAEAVPL